MAPAPAGATAASAPEVPVRDLQDPSLFVNRELSWLEFNGRVLEEARDPSVPLLDRLRFLGIVSSNLDEFFMVRVAGLKQQILGGVSETRADGLLPAAQLAAVSARAHALVGAQYAAWGREIHLDLAQAGHRIVAPAGFPPEQAAAARGLFVERIMPALTPLAVDPGHPFPHLRNKSLNVAVLLAKKAGRRRRREAQNLLAVVQVPAVLPRLYELPSAEGRGHALLDEIIEANAGDLFPGFEVRQTAIFRVTRNWDLLIDEEESEDLLSTVQEELRRRDRGAAVRLEIEADAPEALAGELARALKLDPDDVYRIDGPLQIQDLASLAEADPRPELRVEPVAHCKVALVVRREGRGIRRFVHLGTGNYNHETARGYTDLSLFSAQPALAEDVASLFNMLTGYAEPPRWQKLAVAPFGLRERVVELVERETEKAGREEPARIAAKMNSLVDPVVIRALYQASQAGVEVDLLVRGICCLRPGVPGVSDRIRVTSIVVRFLGHARLFVFGAGPDAECYLSSADWMPRSFHSRVEVMFPVEAPALRARLVEEVMGLALADDVKARRMGRDGSYARTAPGRAPLRSQEALLEAARRAGTTPSRQPPVLRHLPAPRAVAPPGAPAGPTRTASAGSTPSRRRVTAGKRPVDARVARD
jgi:polyphosphate kinase